MLIALMLLALQRLGKLDKDDIYIIFYHSGVLASSVSRTSWRVAPAWLADA
jgi:hypothetical protein